MDILFWLNKINLDAVKFMEYKMINLWELDIQDKLCLSCLKPNHKSNDKGLI